MKVAPAAAPPVDEKVIELVTAPDVLIIPVEGSTLKPVPTLIPPNIDELALFTSIIPVEGSTLKPVPTLIPPKDDELALGKSEATIALKLGAPTVDPVAGPAKI